MNEAILKRALRRARLACLPACLFRALAHSLLLLVLLALVAALADLSFVLDEGARLSCRALVSVLAATWLAAECLLMLRTLRRLPQELDRLNADPRHRVRCALSLPAVAEAGSMTAWLTERAYAEAAEAVRQARRRHPMLRRTARGLLTLLLAAAIPGACWLAAPEATRTLAHRLALPQDDVPPWSPLRFEFIPAAPVVHYGDDLTLAVRISGEGAESVEAVSLLLRAEGLPEQVLPAFRNRQGQWTRTLEKVVTPCRVAFATADGRARSRFVPVEIRHSPRILAGSVRVSPLPYTGRPEQQLMLGGSEIRVPDGSTLRFVLNCDRELSGGYALFRPAGAAEPRRLEATATGREMSLSLTLREPGTLSLQVLDRQGREADSPVQTRLAVLPDMPPTVTLAAPEHESYVVAGEKLPLRVEAGDDYGLARFDLFKALQPYRQHAVSVLKGQGAEQVREQELDTAALGLEPGDVLELRAEVGDANPFRFNIVSTPTTQVFVISPLQYADMLRDEILFSEFMARYEALEGARQDALRSLVAAETARTPEERRAALEQLAAVHARAAALAESMARDYPVFAADEELSALAAEIAAAFRANEQQARRQAESGELPEDEEGWRALLAALRERVDASAAPMEEQTQQARLVELSMRAMEAQQRFAELVEKQRNMVTLFTRYIREKGLSAAGSSAQLEGLGAEQAAIQAEYSAWEEGLSELLAELRQQPALQQQWQYIHELRTACEQAGISGLMEQSVDEAARQRPADAQAYARRALEAMEALLSREASQQAAENALRKDCQCQGMGCKAAETLSQMLDAMKNRQGQGSGRSGPGQKGSRGSRMQGPQRGRYSRGRGQRGDARGRADSGQGSGAEAGERQQGHAEAGPEAPDSSPGSRMPASTDMELVPPVYRDAVRSYFSH